MKEVIYTRFLGYFVPRFGHSQVNTHLWRFDANGSVPHVGHVPLRDGYFAPERVLNEGGLDPYLRGFVEQRAQEIDSLVRQADMFVIFISLTWSTGGKDAIDCMIQ